MLLLCSALPLARVNLLLDGVARVLLTAIFQLGPRLSSLQMFCKSCAVPKHSWAQSVTHFHMADTEVTSASPALCNASIKLVQLFVASLLPALPSLNVRPCSLQMEHCAYLTQLPSPACRSLSAGNTTGLLLLLAPAIGLVTCLSSTHISLPL